MALSNKQQKQAAKLFAKYVRARQLAFNGWIKYLQDTASNGRATASALKAIEQYENRMLEYELLQNELIDLLGESR